jgi:acetyl esterase/lipase
MRFIYTLLICLASVFSQAQQVLTDNLKDVIYSKHDGVALTMDIIKPAYPNGYGIISIVSGGWKSSHEGIGNGKPFTDYGYTVFYVVHPSQPHFIVTEIVADIYRAVRFIRSNAIHFGINPTKLGITGASAGGHLSLMIATTGKAGDLQAKDSIDRVSSEIQAAACFYPPTDYLNWGDLGDVAVGIGKLAAYAPAFGPRANTPEGRTALGNELSPIYNVKAGQASILIVHGDKDNQVPVFQAQRFQKRCKEVGVICKVNIKPGARHGWKNMEEDQLSFIKWFDQHLRGIN